VYERFGRRISADGYKVRVIADVTPDPEGALAGVGKLLVDDALPAPRVLVGSDTGALFAAHAAAQHTPGLDGLVLAGLPLDAAATGAAPSWEEELGRRTACPTHRRTVSEVHPIARGALFSARIPTVLTSNIDYAVIRVPTLVLHGADDEVSPLADVRRRLSGLPDADLVSVAGGRHDALNDVTHRTVAAHVVLFLERLRLGPELPVIAHTERLHT
jgi:alpha-beta hydrolase superfamily lysophospholipase